MAVLGIRQKNNHTKQYINGINSMCAYSLSICLLDMYTDSCSSGDFVLKKRTIVFLNELIYFLILTQIAITYLVINNYYEQRD